MQLFNWAHYLHVNENHMRSLFLLFNAYILNDRYYYNCLCYPNYDYEIRCNILSFFFPVTFHFWSHLGCMTYMWSVLSDRCWCAPSIRTVIQSMWNYVDPSGTLSVRANSTDCFVRYQAWKAMLVSHVSCDSSQCSGIWWERVCRVMQWGAPYSIGFLHVSWKPVEFKSMLIAKACHMSPDCEWWRKGGLKCSLIKRCAAHVNQ